MNKNIIFRVNDQLLQDIKKEVYKQPEKYFNTSHFIRVAIMKELRGLK